MQTMFGILFKIPYTLALYALKGISRLFFSAQLWPRHSYLDHTFRPLKSDLDISVFIESPENRRRFSVFYKWCKRLLPFLGEVNYYSSSTISYLAKYSLNSFELSRDPQLLQNFLQNIHPDFSPTAALVFLQRTFMSDYEHIRRQPRILKWQNHFDNLNAGLQKTDHRSPLLSLKKNELVASVSTAIINLSGFTDKKDAEMERIKLQLLIELVSNKKNYIWNDRLPLEFKNLMIYFPEYVCFYDFDIPDINTAMLPIMTAEIEWYTLVNLRKACDRALIEHGISETELFVKLLSKILIKYKLQEIQKTILKLTEAQNLLKSFI